MTASSSSSIAALFHDMVCALCGLACLGENCRRLLRSYRLAQAPSAQGLSGNPPRIDHSLHQASNLTVTGYDLENGNIEQVK